MIDQSTRSLVAENIDGDWAWKKRQLITRETEQSPQNVTPEEIEHDTAPLSMASDDFSEPHCIHTLFEQQVERSPDAVAVAFLSEQLAISFPQQLTYSQLNRRANQVARYLQKLGVGPGVLVGICMKHSIDLVIGLLSILKAGGAYVTLDPDLPVENLAFILRDSQLPVLLAQAWLADSIGAGGGCRVLDLELGLQKIVCLDADWKVILQGDPQNLFGEVTAKDLAYVFYSSNRGILVEHCAVHSRLQWLQDEFALSETDAVLLTSPPSLDTLVLEIFWPLAYGARLVMAAAETRDPVEWLQRLLVAQRINIVHFTPSGLSAFLQTCSERDEKAAMRDKALIALNWVLCSGEPLRQTVVDTFFQHMECGLCYLYNPPEAATEVASYVCVPHENLSIVPVGYPTLDCAVYVLDECLQLVPIGIPGEIYIATSNLARGYLNNPEETARRFVDNPFSDIAGEKMFKTESQGRRRTEGALEWWGSIPHRFRASASCDLTPAQATPLIGASEIEHRQLIAEYRKALGIATAGGIPRTDLERQLATIWQEVLGVQQVSIYDNFFELGGDSIIAIQAIAKANYAGLPFTPKQLNDHPTIAELSAVAGTALTIQAEQGLVTGPVPLVPSQHWFFGLNLPNPHHHNHAYLFKVQQVLNPALLKQAVQHLLMHHDALRLRFVQTELGWQQFHAGFEGEAPFSCVDLSALSSAEQIPALEAAAAKQQASLHLSEGPIAKFVLFDLGVQKPSYLLIIIHHLAVDRVSERIVLEDLHTVFQQLCRGEAIQLPSKTTSFKLWAEQLAEHAYSAELQQELPYWLAEPRTRVPHLPVDYPDGIGAFGSMRSVLVSLSVSETRALLRQVPQIYHAQINDVLLTATLQAFTQWTRTDSLLIDLVGHGREPRFENIDLSRTVGWISTTFPLLLTLKESSRLEDVLESVKEQLRSVPNKGLNYGGLYYLGQATDAVQRLRAMPRPEVDFSYLGQFDQTLEKVALFQRIDGDIHLGPTEDPRGVWRYLIDIFPYVVDNRLEVNWLYNENIHRRSTIEALVQGFVEALQAILTGR
jgi:non-ribosomal peptide synthase protein (TIGR01720 family)